jgi:hypothetical protein
MRAGLSSEKAGMDAIPLLFRLRVNPAVSLGRVLSGLSAADDEFAKLKRRITVRQEDRVNCERRLIRFWI